MKLFIDTNIFVEYFEKRQQFESVRILFNTLEDGVHTGYISTGSFYTLAYIIDQGFKRKGYNKLDEWILCVRAFCIIGRIESCNRNRHKQ